MPIEQLRAHTPGVNQQGLRDYNERLILTMIQKAGALPGADIARQAGLSPQTVSVILRRLEQDGLIVRGEPIRGTVGKPRVPMALAPGGALSIGVNIGRRSAQVVLIDFTGEIRDRRRTTYRWPTPEIVLPFVRESIEDLAGGLSEAQRDRISGIGIAKPFELWNWHDSVGAPADALNAWKETNFPAELGRYTDLPVFLENDATAACRAEQVWGHGRVADNWASFFIGAFIGGGLVLGGTVFDGARGNAAAFGSLPSRGPGGNPRTLIDTASLYLLEASIEAAGQEGTGIWQRLDDWSEFEEQVSIWVANAGRALADAARTVTAVTDVEAVVIDGAMPRDVLHRLVATIEEELPRLDLQGLVRPRILPGSCGPEARAMGGAIKPVQAQLLLAGRGLQIAN